MVRVKCNYPCSEGNVQIAIFGGFEIYLVCLALSAQAKVKYCVTLKYSSVYTCHSCSILIYYVALCALMLQCSLHNICKGNQFEQISKFIHGINWVIGFVSSEMVRKISWCLFCYWAWIQLSNSTSVNKFLWLLCWVYCL